MIKLNMYMTATATKYPPLISQPLEKRKQEMRTQGTTRSLFQISEKGESFTYVPQPGLVVTGLAWDVGGSGGLGGGAVYCWTRTGAVYGGFAGGATYSSGGGGGAVYGCGRNSTCAAS
jgi:hypothetical protein